MKKRIQLCTNLNGIYNTNVPVLNFILLYIVNINTIKRINLYSCFLKKTVIHIFLLCAFLFTGKIDGDGIRHKGRIWSEGCQTTFLKLSGQFKR